MYSWDSVAVDAAAGRQGHKPDAKTTLNRLRRPYVIASIGLLIIGVVGLLISRSWLYHRVTFAASSQNINLASFEEGARVIPIFTEPKPPQVIWTKTAFWSTYHPPAIVLTEGPVLGQCWTISYGRGSLGIALSRKGVILSIGIEHIAEALIEDPATAPKTIQIWGMNESGSSIQDIRDSLSAGRQVPSLTLFGSITYNATLGTPVQNFTVSTH
ncbi:hypothetical protein FRC14_005648 [Serendipita sp. 396]|nr:hypothetical protein FRC14_005648 [Serendipita sp. 396]KAG8780181.1 hypothetical protein FRC15_009701 [Serendipita sp. 397]KAG8850040.1 hypothetical protein FRB91_009404 [Serendipita sp. 411]KAG8865725.1 hypothetical protein FRC20_009556 [Serendipita sp. 405]